MIKINLIYKKNKFHMPTVLGVNLNDLSIIGIAIAIVFFYIPDLFVADYLKADEEVLQTKLVSLRREFRKVNKGGEKGLKEKLNAYHKVETELNQREKYVNEILRFRVNPYKVLYRIAQDIPTKLWLTSLEIQTDTTIVFKGATFNYTAIGELITSLNETAFFRQSLQIPSNASAIVSDKEKRIEIFEIRGQVVSFDPWKNK